jgi:hypothetical protein|tara:strand:+ start:1341 stop:1553 length:213 start_codon:yes stop_codon:yes gene_type:complete
MSRDDMLDYFNQLEKQSKAIKEEVLKLCWYMRGSISYNEGMMLSPDERTMISNIVKDNLETTKKSGMPFF